VSDLFDITAFDISAKALVAYARHHDGQATLVQGNIMEIPSEPETYDGIFNLGVMEHFTEEEIARILVEFHRVLQPGGKIVLFWPPSYGPSVKFLKLVHFVFNDVMKREIRLHPPELTHVSSREQVERYMAAAGFTLEQFYFGLRDMFTHRIVVARRD
jgi:predicted SAM-dependent methyltransferase